MASPEDFNNCVKEAAHALVAAKKVIIEAYSKSSETGRDEVRQGLAPDRLSGNSMGVNSFIFNALSTQIGAKYFDACVAKLGELPALPPISDKNGVLTRK